MTALSRPKLLESVCLEQSNQLRPRHISSSNQTLGYVNRDRVFVTAYSATLETRLQPGGIMNALVRRALHERRVLRFCYDGGLREVEPHCHGCSKENNETLLASVSFAEVAKNVCDRLVVRTSGNVGTANARSRVLLSRSSLRSGTGS